MEPSLIATNLSKTVGGHAWTTRNRNIQFASYLKIIMNNILKFIRLIFLFGLLSCEKDTEIKFHLDSIDSNEYYSKEIIPTDYQMIYGKWKLYDISGGFSGSGYEPDYDYLEIKSIGIYGLIRNNELFEYGKIELNTFDNNTENLLQIRLVPTYHTGQEPYMHPAERYIGFKGSDSLDLFSPCCDMYHHHYKRSK